jgi:hypothetical protein
MAKVSEKKTSEKKATPKSEVPEVKAPEVKETSKGERHVKVKFIRDMPRLKIAGEYYDAKKDETKNLPVFVAICVKGNNGKGTQYAV